MKAADKAVSDSLAALLTAQATLNSSTETDKEKLATLKKNVEDARQKLSENQQAQSKVMEALNKFNMANGDSKRRPSFHLDDAANARQRQTKRRQLLG